MQNNTPVIALTFDDGPNTVLTPKVLDILEENDAVVTFFYVGENITEEAVPVMKRAVSLGCEIGNHSLTHAHMPDELTKEQIIEEVNITSQKIKAVLGKEPVFFRPPFFEYDEKMLEVIDKPFITGEGIDDWLPEVGEQERIDRVLSLAKDGAIILLHDFPGNECTMEALKSILPALKERGFKTVTVSQLFETKGKKPENGVVYTKVEGEG